MEIKTLDVEHLDAEALKDAVDSMTHIAIDNNELEEVQAMDKPERKGWMRNKPCPCNSGKKFKRCCWNRIKGE